MMQVKKLDNFVRDILKDKRKQNDLGMDVTFKKKFNRQMFV